jgi:hypothetical protein
MDLLGEADAEPLAAEEPLDGESNPLVGPDESMPIAMINSYSVINDPTHGVLSWSFPPAARVTIARGAVPVEPASWGAIKATWTR